MQDDRINNFLNSVSPYIALKVKILLKVAGIDFEEKGWGPGLVLSIRKGERKLDFFLYNLLLEIATVDRDEVPLRFDENLSDFDHFKAKVNSLIESKLRILFQLLAESDVDKAVDNISKNAQGYERIHIWKIDPKNPPQSHHDR